MGLFWIDLAGTQRAPRDSPSWSLFFREGLADPEESVRARAQELVERVWAQKAEAGAGAR